MITRVEAYLLSFPLAESPVVKRDAMLVRILTDEGLIGYAPGLPCRRTKQVIDEIVGPFLLGQEADDPDALRILFQQGPGADAEASKVYCFVEMALYDLAGKARQVPVSELIGGRVRDRIRLYASSRAVLSPDEHAAEAMRARALGFSAYKMRLGRGPEEDVASVRLAREQAGPDFELMVDARRWSSNGAGYPRSTVERLAREMAESRVAWIEEPLPSELHEAYADFKQLNLAPLAGGGHEESELRFLDLIESCAVDYVQMDLVAQGGYATARRLFPDIARAGLRFGFRTGGTALDVIAAAHLGVCWPTSMVRWLEYPWYSPADPFPLAAEIVKKPLPVERGELVVPKTPGLGVEIDESVIWRYPWQELIPHAS